VGDPVELAFEIIETIRDQDEIYVDIDYNTYIEKNKKAPPIHLFLHYGR